jgi:hypothetical protein
MRAKRRLTALAAAFVVVLSSQRARAQAAETAATALFDEGRRLMAERHYAEACPKLAESERLAPSGGTLLNLADCYEHTGQTASAWAAWKDAAGRADAAGKEDVEKKALARAAALEAALARLTIAVTSDSDVPALEVKRDGVIVGRAEYGLAIPVDPGAHVIEATAPKRRAWSTTVEVSPKQQDARVTVSLAGEVLPEPPAVPVPPSVTSPSSTLAEPLPEQPASGAGSAQRTVGLLTMGVGVAGVAVGTVFGLTAMSKNNDAMQPQNCRTATLCTASGLALTSDAKDAATLSTIAFSVGGAALVGGGVLWFTAPSRHATGVAALRVRPALTPSYGGVSVAGPW